MQSIAQMFNKTKEQLIEENQKLREQLANLLDEVYPPGELDKENPETWERKTALAYERMEEEITDAARELDYKYHETLAKINSDIIEVQEEERTAWNVNKELRYQLQVASHGGETNFRAVEALRKLTDDIHVLTVEYEPCQLYNNQDVDKLTGQKYLKGFDPEDDFEKIDDKELQIDEMVDCIKKRLQNLIGTLDPNREKVYYKQYKLTLNEKTPNWQNVPYSALGLDHSFKEGLSPLAESLIAKYGSREITMPIEDKKLESDGIVGSTLAWSEFHKEE